VPATPPNPPRKRRRSHRGDLTEHASLNPKDAFTQSGDALSFRRASLPAQVLNQLRRGQFLIEADIDLHGLSAHAAEATLRHYLQRSLLAGHRCIRVVHGKGQRSGPLGPVIKQSVAFWLRHWEAVQAFATTRPRDGGSGALLVLLNTL
jgi:hypothetical protein